MTLTRLSLSNPVAVVVACILIAIFGIISLTRLPIQMTPDISRPEILVSTTWRAAAPNEVESEIIELQENVLRSIPGLLRMQSSANFGRGGVSLQFIIGTDMNRALIEVMNRLNQVPRYPVDADEPVIVVGGQNFDKVISWFAITARPGNDRPIESYDDFVNDEIVTRLERVPGVSEVGAFGGRRHEVRIFGSLRHKTRPGEDAGDLCQKEFVLAFRNIGGGVWRESERLDTIFWSIRSITPSANI